MARSVAATLKPGERDVNEKQREDIRQALKEQTARHQANPDEARAFLLRTGIYTNDGELAPEFGGSCPPVGSVRSGS
jgi:7-keto-8-aminopelargonate synthetase-like enzyme